MKKRHYLCLIISLLGTTSTIAETIWHCSREPSQELASAPQSLDNQFTLASTNYTIDSINVSLRDLYDVFSGIPVQLGGLPLSACFKLDDKNLSEEALNSLGLPLSTLQRLGKRASIVNSHVHLVRTDDQMSTCIGKNYPAIGYLSKPLTTSHMLPCF